MINELVPGPHTFFIARTSSPPNSVVRIGIKRMCIRRRFRSRLVTFSPAISVLGEAAETIWRQVNMAIVKSSLRFTTIVHGSFMFSFIKSPFTLEFQMLLSSKLLGSFYHGYFIIYLLPFYSHESCLTLARRVLLRTS